MKTIIRKQMVFAVLILVLFITGCGVKSTIAVDENGNSTSTSYMYFTEEEVRELAESDTSLDETKYIGDEQIDGTTYRVYKSDDSSTEETAQICTADKYYIKVSSLQCHIHFLWHIQMCTVYCPVSVIECRLHCRGI